MFSFRHDKVGFFSGLVLMIICGGTFIATLVLLIVGAALGDFRMFLWPIRWLLLGWWVACIATVLTRVYILSWQMNRRRAALAAPPDADSGHGGSPSAGADAPAHVVAVEAEVARARAEAERARAIGAIGVATVLGVASALVIVSLLATGLPDRGASAPVQIVAWSVAGGVIVVVVLACVIGLRRREPRPLHPPPASPAVPVGIREHPSPP